MSTAVQSVSHFQDPTLFRSEACFSKVPKLFGPISGATIPFISSQRRGSKRSNFAIILVFLLLNASGLRFDNWLFGPEKFAELSRNRSQVPVVQILDSAILRKITIH